MTLLVRESEVVQLLTMEDTLHAVEGAFRSQGERTSINRARQPLSRPRQGEYAANVRRLLLSRRYGPEGVYLLPLRHPIHGPPLQRRVWRPSRHRASRPSWQDAHRSGFRCRHQISRKRRGGSRGYDRVRGSGCNAAGSCLRGAGYRESQGV